MAHLGIIAAMEHSPGGGSEYLWIQTAEEVRRRGHEVSVICRKWNPLPEAHRRLASLGVRFYQHDPEWSGRRLVRKFEAMGVQFSKTGIGSFKGLARGKPDLTLISQGGNWDGFFWTSLCRQSGLRFASLAHAASEASWPPAEHFDEIRNNFKAASANYFVSHANLRLTEIQISEVVPRAKVVRNPYLVPWKSELPWLPISEGICLACPARFVLGDKGQHLLVLALADSRWKSRKFKVTLFGAGPNQRHLEEMKRFFQVEALHFGGHESDVSKIWKNHHALALTSRLEGLPLAVVEAMLCARPCLVTNAGGNTELLEDGKNGWVIPAPEVGLVLEGLERVWQDRERLQEMGQEAQKCARREIPEHPESIFADELLSLMDHS